MCVCVCVWQYLVKEWEERELARGVPPSGVDIFTL